MRSFLGAAILVVLAAAVPGVVPPTRADDVPCEDMLKDLRAAEQGATLGAADAAKIKELEDKGIERCNADDDARADEFFAQALKILGK
ncbi:MAG TPA: hypothetical protein PLR41_12555 [Alphaproteobacteria bacterium]|nr:hypothetical protein [Alphaproteobacteria bacterium]